MKKHNLLRFFIIATMCMFDFAVFAQDTIPTGPGDDGDGGVETGDDPPLPINGKLIWLAVAGILFALYIYRNYNQKQKA